MLAWSSGLSSPRLVVSRSQQSTNPASELAALFQERTVHAADNHRTDFVTDWSHSVQRKAAALQSRGVLWLAGSSVSTDEMVWHLASAQLRFYSPCITQLRKTNGILLQ